MITRYTPKKEVKPYHPATLDIETQEDGAATFIGMRWQDSANRFHTLNTDSWSDFLPRYREAYKASDIDTRKRLRKMFAHNGGGFDWLHYSRYLMDSGEMVGLKSYQTGSKMVGLDVKQRIAGERFMLRCRDSLALMPGSLANLTKTFKVKTQKIDLGGKLPEQVRQENPELFYKYAEADVQAGQEVVKKFWDLIYKHAGNIGELPMTLPSLAMRLWRMTLDKPIMTPSRKKLKALEREAYTGGRTEALKPGKYDRVDVYDINSQYPAVMRNGVFPVDYRGAWVREYEGNHGIYRVEFNQTNRTKLPLLHIKTKTGLRFVYEGTGVYTQPEIERLLHIGGTIKVIEGYEYYRMGNPFRDFIDKWYTIRKEATARGDEGLAYVCKILMNSLYGKFGQAESGMNIEIWDNDQIQENLDKGKTFKNYGDCVQVQEERKQEFVFAGIAAYVTAQARLLLYGYTEAAAEQGCETVYMDTDSLHIVGGANLPTGPELGQIKHEYRGAAVYVGKKLYTLVDIGKIKAKGIGKKAAALLTPEKFIGMVYRGESVLCEYDSFPTPLEVFTGVRKPAVILKRTRTLRCLSPPSLTPS